MTQLHNLAWLEGTGAGAALRSMRASGQLAEVLPEVDALYGVPQNPEHHPEVCTGLHIEMCLDMAERLNATPAAKFAVLMHDLGKALTPKNELPKHIDHENRGIEPVMAVCNRLGVPQEMRELALAVCEYHLDAHRSLVMRSKSVIRFVERTGLLKSEQYAEDFLIACEADARGRLGKEEKPYPQGKFLRRVRSFLSFLPAPPEDDRHSRLWNERHTDRLQAIHAARLPFEIQKKVNEADNYC